MHWSSQQHHMGMTVDKNKGLIQLYLENWLIIWKYTSWFLSSGYSNTPIIAWIIKYIHTTLKNDCFIVWTLASKVPVDISDIKTSLMICIYKGQNFWGTQGEPTQREAFIQPSQLTRNWTTELHYLITIMIISKVKWL